MPLSITTEEDDSAERVFYRIEGHRGTANNAVKAAKKKFSKDNDVPYRHLIGKKIYRDDAGVRSNVYILVMNKMSLYNQ